MNTVVLPTFRRSAFRRLPRSLQAPWGPGMPGTHFVLRGDEYDVDIQDVSPLTTGRAALVKRRRKKRRQRADAPPHRRLDDGRPLNALTPTAYRSECRAA